MPDRASIRIRSSRGNPTTLPRVVADGREVADLGEREQPLVLGVVTRDPVEQVHVLGGVEPGDGEPAQPVQVEPLGQHRVHVPVERVLDQAVGARPEAVVVGDRRPRVGRLGGDRDVDAVHRPPEPGGGEGAPQLCGDGVDVARLPRLPQVHVEDGLRAPTGRWARCPATARTMAGSVSAAPKATIRWQRLPACGVVGDRQPHPVGVDQREVGQVADPVVAAGGGLEHDVAFRRVAVLVPAQERGAHGLRAGDRAPSMCRCPFPAARCRRPGRRCGDPCPRTARPGPGPAAAGRRTGTGRRGRGP